MTRPTTPRPHSSDRSRPPNEVLRDGTTLQSRRRPDSPSRDPSRLRSLRTRALRAGPPTWADLWGSGVPRRPSSNPSDPSPTAVRPSSDTHPRTPGTLSSLSGVPSWCGVTRHRPSPGPRVPDPGPRSLSHPETRCVLVSTRCVSVLTSACRAPSVGSESVRLCVWVSADSRLWVEGRPQGLGTDGRSTPEGVTQGNLGRTGQGEEFDIDDSCPSQVDGRPGGGEWAVVPAG